MNKITTYFFLFFAISVMNAQGPQAVYKIQARNGENIKDGGARCFVFSFTKNKSHYAFLLTTKDLIAGYKTLTFFFDKGKTIELPIDDEHVIQTSNPKNQLVAVPFLFIHQKDDTIAPVFLVEELIPETLQTDQKNIDELKQAFENWTNKK